MTLRRAAGNVIPMSYGWETLSRAEKRRLLAEVAESATPRGPHVVELYWQDRCNVDCFFCSTAEVRSGNATLPGERIIRLFDELSAMGTRGVRLAGGGEPLFRKDAPELLRAARERGLRVTDVTTNGVLLTEGIVRELLATGCDQVTVSLNAGDPRTYAAMMQTTPANFDRVIANVKRAAAMKKAARASTVIRLQFLVYRDNYRTLPQMYRLFRESGADHIVLSGLYPVRPMPAMSAGEIEEMLGLYGAIVAEDRLRSLETFAFWERPIDDRIAAAARSALHAAPLSYRLRSRLRRMTSLRDLRRRRAQELSEFCLIGWYSAVIDARGNVTPCCMLQDRPDAVLGNILEAPFSEVWRGERFERLRRELREIMARRGEVANFGHACLVEEKCAAEGACPNRSFYWNDDVAFRKAFHRFAGGLSAPPGEPFAALPPAGLPSGAKGRSLPVLPGAPHVVH